MQASLTLHAFLNVSPNIEPIVNFHARCAPCTLCLINTQTKIFGDPGEGFPRRMCVEHRKLRFEVVETDSFDFELERTRLDESLCKNAPLGAEIDGPASHCNPTQ